MRRTQLLCAIGVSLWSAVVAGSQATDAGALSEALRAHVQDERFGIVTSIRGLPLGVRDGLQTLFGSRTLDIAEPGAEFQGPMRSSIRSCRSVGWSRRGARPITASSTTSAAASPTRGMWRCFTGRRPRLDSSGAVPRRGPGDNRRRSERDPVRSDQGPGQVLGRPSCGSDSQTEARGPRRRPSRLRGPRRRYQNLPRLIRPAPFHTAPADGSTPSLLRLVVDLRVRRAPAVGRGVDLDL